MELEQNVPTEGSFNPEQKIDLTSRANNQPKKSKKTNANRINLSEKINLKNYQAQHKQQVQKKSSKKQKKQKKQKNTNVNIKLEHYETKNQSQNTVTGQPIHAEKMQSNTSQKQQPITYQISHQPQSQLTPPGSTLSKITTTPIYHKNYNSITTKNIKLEHPSFYQPVRVNPMEKIELGPKIQRSLQSQSSLITNPKQYKIRVLSSDITSMRYQCFCSRQYLSYCATYHHLKKDHFDFLKENRRFSSTNVQDMIDPVYGFKIKKITRQRLKCQENESKEQIEKLPKHTKEKIKAQSQQIQQLLAQLKGIEEERDKQVQHLKLFQRKLHKAGELISEYQNMISSFQQIFNILNIRQITQKLNNGPTVFQENDPNDEEYFP